MTYDTQFYVAETKVAIESAQVVLPYVLEQTKAEWVIDVGCGTGGWARVAKDLGCHVLGIDQGVPADQRVIAEYMDHDLTLGYDCGDDDLAICLEVAEHLPEDAGPRLVRGLAKAPIILFSAATPGQPGVDHINCQPHEYWHGLFAKYGYNPDHIGPLFREPVADFYCRNMFLYRP